LEKNKERILKKKNALLDYSFQDKEEKNEKRGGEGEEEEVEKERT